MKSETPYTAEELENTPYVGTTGERIVTSKFLLGNRLKPYLVNLLDKEQARLINQANVTQLTLIAKALKANPEYRKLIGLPLED